MTAEEQKKMQELEAESAALKERLLVAQRTLAKYAQMLFGQKTERCRLPEKPEELTGSLFEQEMDPAEQARLDREAEKALAGQDKLIHVEAHDRKVRKAIDTSRLEVKEEHLYPDLDNKEDYTEMAPEVTDNRYKIDDNMVENSIRPLAVGRVISKNLRAKVHPYYTEYRPLQTLCLQILRMEEVKYGDSSDEICGILFDGAWLWEEYVNTILSNHGFKHPENKLHKGGIYLFDDHSGIRYPDFYKDDMVLDAKYKRLGSYDKVSKLDRNDIHQVMAYMTTLKVNRGGFVAPLAQKQSKVPTSHLKGSAATLSIFGIEICKSATSYAEFCEKMGEMEDRFVESLKQF